MNVKNDSNLHLNPNGFPAPPEWAWHARLAVYPGEGCDGGNLKLLELTDTEIEAACAHYAERGVTLMQALGFHARMMWIPHLERLTQINRRIVEAAHRHGMRVYDHHTCNGMWKHVTDQLEGWCPDEATCVDIRFGRRYVPDQPKFCCLNHPGFRKHYYRYITDYVERTGVDAMMCDDMLLFYGQYGCGCDHCRARFAQALGYDMPETGQWPLDDYDDPVWRGWMRFRTDSIMAFKRELRRLLPREFVLFTDSSGTVLDLDDCHHAGQTGESLAKASDGAIVCESGGCAFREKKMPRQLAYWNHPNWEQMLVVRKQQQAVSRHYQIPAFEHHYPATPEDGWFCWALNKFTGMCYWRDDAWQYGGPRYADEFSEWTPDVDYFNWEAKHEDLWGRNQGVADVGILFSQQTKLNLGADPQPHGEEFAGWTQTLMSAGVFFDAVIDPDLESPEQLKRFKLLILPNAAALSERQLGTIRQFVRDGGNVIATHQTSLLDESGASRGDFGLADLLGVHLGDKPTTLRSAWLLDHRHRETPFADGVPPRLPFQPVLPIRWDGENEDRKALAWAELVRVSFGWPTAPATVEACHGAGRVLYHSPPVGQLAYREGPCPIWNRAQHLEEITLREEKNGVRFTIKQHPTSEEAKFLFVDEGHDGYRQLILNSVAHLLPTRRMTMTGKPDALRCDAYRLPASGDMMVSLLNVGGMLYPPGASIAPGVAPSYPPLRGTAALTLRGEGARSATLFSPDQNDPIELRLDAKENGAVDIGIPLEKVERLAFIRMTTEK